MVETPTMSDRENILGRIRAARDSRKNSASARPMRPEVSVRALLPLVGETFEERLELFRSNARELRAEFELLDSPSALAARIRALRDSEGWKRVGSHRGALTELGCSAAGLPVTWTDSAYDARELERCEAALTGCDALVAQTGSVLVTSRSAGGRALSVLPSHHIVVARRAQLLADLPAAWEWLQQKYAPDYPSFVSLITGPSRTGDIERILVLGAHGPKKLTILCL